MSKRYRESDISDTLGDRSVAVIGYGNQGAAHALNLRDSGVSIVVGTRPGAGRERAVADGFEPASISDAVKTAGLVALTLPDETIRDVFETEVAPHMQDGAVLVFAHGFAVTYKLVDPPFGAVLVSPSGPGSAVREEFLAGRGVPGFVAAEPSSLLPMGLAYAKAIGLARAGVIETTFREETECDLFGEQVVLCGGMPELAVAAFETLVEAGYSAEVAYTECVQQVQLLASLIAKLGVAGMKKKISDTAEWGSYAVGSRIIDPHVRQTMAQVLAEIRSGRFSKEWIAEAANGKQTLAALRENQASRLNERIFTGLTNQT